MDREGLEEEIVTKELTAPRVTIEDIEKKIVQEEYFFQGTYTICVLVLENGFKVSGSMGCISQENYDIEIGKKYSRQKAVNEIWKLEGYLLAQRLFEMMSNQL